MEQWYFPLHYTRTSCCSLWKKIFSGLGKQKENEWIRKEAGSRVSQFLPQSKTSVRRIWSEDWRLFIWVSFMNYVQIGEGGGRMWGGTRETLLTNQKAEVPFLSHLGYSELGDSFSWLQRETIFQNVQCVIFSVSAPVTMKKKMYAYICASVQEFVFSLRTGYTVCIFRLYYRRKCCPNCMSLLVPSLPLLHFLSSSLSLSKILICFIGIIIIKNAATGL